MARPRSPHRDIWDGYFLAQADNADEDSEIEDDPDDDELLDPSEAELYGSGAEFVKSSTLHRKIVHFHDYATGASIKVEGAFPMTDPWWAATLTTGKTYAGRKKLIGYPAYRLRTDHHLTTDGVVMLFLKKCNVEPQHIEIFQQFLSNTGRAGQLHFENLRELLEQFGASSKDNSQIMSAINCYLKGDEAQMAFKSLELGNLFTLLPGLLPRKFKNILQMGSGRLGRMNDALTAEPWIFGYQQLLASKLGLIGCEAQLQHLVDSELIAKMDDRHVDALKVYDVMKWLCRRYGHTYCHEHRLPALAKFRDHGVKDYSKALEFLRENDVIVREPCITQARSVRLYLFRYHRAESSIAQGIDSLLRRHEYDPLTFDLDFDRAEFRLVKNDPDQKRAAAVMSQNPVTVLSGKGGCGKTEVVSRVFQVAYAILKHREQVRFEEEMFSCAELDDLTLTQSVSHMEQSKLYSQEALDESIGFDDADTTVADSQGKAAGGAGQNTETTSGAQPESVSGSWLGCREADKENPLILMTAPTGKAANLLGRRSGFPAFTLHQVMHSSFRREENLTSDKHAVQQPWKFAKVQVWVVDECSLVPVSVFNSVLTSLLAKADLRKVVLLGDVNQLPSIEPGYFLGDMYRALVVRGCSVLLRHNHRAESQLIVDNASAIADGRCPLADPGRHFHIVDLEELRHDQDLDTTADDLGMEQDAAVRQLLEGDSPSLGGHEHSQFVAFRRRDCAAINEICCRHYAGHPTVDARKKAQFCVGDKVCCTRNAMVVDHMTDETLRLCNGEIFFVTGDLEEVSARGRRTRLLMLTGDTGRQLKVLFNDLVGRCRLQHAWARTIHTYQGSESETVIYIVGSPGGQTWQHVYTAVTRGRQCVVMVTRPSFLVTAVRSQPNTRNTSLRERVSAILGGPPGNGPRDQGNVARQGAGFIKASTLGDGGGDGVPGPDRWAVTGAPATSLHQSNFAVPEGHPPAPNAYVPRVTSAPRSRSANSGPSHGATQDAGTRLQQERSRWHGALANRDMNGTVDDVIFGRHDGTGCSRSDATPAVKVEESSPEGSSDSQFSDWDDDVYVCLQTLEADTPLKKSPLTSLLTRKSDPSEASHKPIGHSTEPPSNPNENSSAGAPIDSLIGGRPDFRPRILFGIDEDEQSSVLDRKSQRSGITLRKELQDSPGEFHQPPTCSGRQAESPPKGQGRGDLTSATWSPKRSRQPCDDREWQVKRLHSLDAATHVDPHADPKTSVPGFSQGSLLPGSPLRPRIPVTSVSPLLENLKKFTL